MDKYHELRERSGTRASGWAVSRGRVQPSIRKGFIKAKGKMIDSEFPVLGAFKQRGMIFSQILVLGGRLFYLASKAPCSLRSSRFHPFLGMTDSGPHGSLVGSRL